MKAPSSRIFGKFGRGPGSFLIGKVSVVIPEFEKIRIFKVDGIFQGDVATYDYSFKII